MPGLVFTSVFTGGITTNTAPGADVFIEQNVPPIQVVVPFSLGLALAVLVIICLIALGVMVYVVSRPSIGKVLRLNED